MTEPKRIQLKRLRGWRMPPNTRKVDRSTRWGNPFIIGTEYVRRRMQPGGGQSANTVADHAHAVSLFRRFTARETKYQLDARQYLYGKNLACWCELCDAHKDGKPFSVECPDCAPCHVDVLGPLANQEHDND